MEEESEVKRRVLKCISVALVTSFMMSSIPVTPAKAETVPEEISSIPQILSEMTEFRTETTKQFRLSDGTYQTEDYGVPVHYKESETGAWQDIDHTLIQKGNGFSAKASPYAFVLPENMDDAGIQLTDERYPVSWTYERSAPSKMTKVLRKADTKKKNRTADEQVEEKNQQFVTLSNLTSQSVYPDVFPYVDLEYILTPNGLKENILLRSDRAQHEFVMTYRIGRLKAEQKDSRTIQLHNEQNQTIYEIAAPYMEDANGEISDGVSLTILEQTGGTLKMSILADPHWLKDEGRAFPVEIDPSFTGFNKEITSQTIYQSGATSDADILTIGNASGVVSRSVTKMDVLPELPASAVIVDATFRLSQTSCQLQSGEMQIDAHMAGTNWTNYHSRILDYTFTNPSNNYGRLSWNITMAVKKWYEDPASNTGILLKQHDESIQSTVGAKHEFVSKPDYMLYAGTAPFSVTWRDFTGTEEYWSFSSHAAGANGTGMVNHYTGHLTYTESILANAGLRMPLAITSSYNVVNKDQVDYTGRSRYGLGWTPSFTQKMSVRQLPDSGTGTGDIQFQYVYTDVDGTTHYFLPHGRGNFAGTVDEDGLGLEVVSGNEFMANLVIKDKSDNKLYFDTNGQLYAITDHDGNRTEYTYTSGVLTLITEPNGRQTTLTYNSQSQLTGITAPDGRDVSFSYIEGTDLLEKITYPDGLYSHYQYDAQNRLIAVSTNAGSGSSILYRYVSDTGFARYKIRRVEEHGAEQVTYAGSPDTLGNFLEFSYSNVDETTMNNQSVIQDNRGRHETWSFDSYGRVTGVVNADGSIANTDYTPAATGKTANKISRSTMSDKYVHNLLINSGAEFDAWNGGYWTASDNWYTSISMTEHKLGERSFEVFQNAVRPSPVFQQQRVYGITPSQTYTISADMKIEGTLTGQGAGLFAILYDRSNAVIGTLLTGDLLTTTNNEWVRVSTTVTTTADTVDMNVCAGLYSTNGLVYFDNIQLEEGSVPNAYNMVQESSFDNLQYSWTLGGLDPVDGRKTVDGETALYFSGKGLSWKYAYQSIPIHAKNQSLSISAMAKGQGVKHAGDQKGLRFAVVLSCEYETPDAFGETVQWVDPYEFNYEVSGWQNVSATFTPDPDRMVNRVVVYLCYYYQVHDVYFDHVQVSPTNGGYRYAYDANGNVIQSTAASDVETTLQNNAYNEVDSVTDAKGNTDHNTYYTPDYPHRLKTSETTFGDNRSYFTDYEYDAFGNLSKTTVRNADSTMKMSSAAAYADNGNQPFSQTDARGQTAYTHHNPANGLLNSTVSPKGHVTQYTYDSAGRPLTVTRGGAKIQYAYQNGRLSGITSGNDTKQVAYHLLYDVFGNLTQTKVGNQVLASNTYEANNGNLIRTDYGNGQYVEVSYDPFDRITAMTYNGSDQAYTYTYNNKGELWETFDPLNNLRTRFEYDGSGRLVRESRSNGAVFTQKYDEKSLANSSKISYNGTTVEQNRVYQGSDLLMRTDFYKNGGKVLDIVNEYDGLARNYRQTITNRSGATGGLVNTITYLVGADGGTTDFVQNYAVKKIGAAKDLITYSYTYDADGNIESIKENGVLKAAYTYDERNQLIREDRASDQQTIVYEYDVLGNLTAKKTCAYGTTTPLSTVVYAYSDTNWQDKLTAYNGQSITYDAIGNPLSYRDGISLTWQNGRQLESFRNTMHNVSYRYNADGIRTRKSVNGIVTEYLLNGSDIVMQKSGSDVLWFYGSGFDLNGTRYLYVKNAQGDITGITDAAGNLVVEYTYDSWGKLLETTGSLAKTVGMKNPFRYRGYYYDTETGLYYVQSRYYDPVTGRFLNADMLESMLLQSNSMLAGNLFAYCFNNPINYTDHSGMVVTPANVIGAIVGGIIGAVGGHFLSRWFADRLGLRGWKRNVFIWGLTAVISASAVAIGYFIGPYVAKAWGSFSSKLAGLVRTSYKSISITQQSMKHINVSKHLWNRVLNKVTNAGIESLIHQGIRHGTWNLLKNGSIQILWQHKGQIIEITGKVINKIFRISDAWVRR